MLLYAIANLVLVAIALPLLRSSWWSHSPATPLAKAAADESRFPPWQRRFLAGYLLATLSDWLQGPYVYRLYELCFPEDVSAIGTLFIAGFLSSAVLGTLVGGLADTYGRRLLCMTFCVLYIVSCMTKLTCSFSVLMVGRVTGGIATSLLFSVFESWMVDDHARQGFPDSWRPLTFGRAQQGNSLMAILAGVLAHSTVWFLGGGSLGAMTDDGELFAVRGPFVLSALVNVACLLVIAGYGGMPAWDENYGNSTISPWTAFVSAVTLVVRSPRLVLLGLVQSLFEGSMYIMVFMWSPVLQKGDAHVPHGWVFALFMIAALIGSTLFSLQSLPVQTVLLMVLGGSGVALLMPALTDSLAWNLFGFLVFEMLVGIWWPASGALRALMVPQAQRAALSNFARVPLNLMVVCLLANIEKLNVANMFGLCSVSMFVALILLLVFVRSSPSSSSSSSTGAESESTSDDSESDASMTTATDVTSSPTSSRR